MNIGIIGAGAIGSCLAEKFVRRGYRVSIANSRGPASLRQVAAATGAEAATVADALQNKDVIVVSIPQKNITALPRHLFAQLPPNVVVIDTCNYYPLLRDGNIAALDEGGIDSAWVQAQLGVSIVKAFNNITAESLRDRGRLPGDKHRIALSVAGDNTTAKAVACTLVNDAGFDCFHIGPLAASWKQQPGSSIYCRDIGLETLQQRVAAMPATWEAGRTAATRKRLADEALMASDFPAYMRSLQAPLVIHPTP